MRSRGHRSLILVLLAVLALAACSSRKPRLSAADARISPTDTPSVTMTKAPSVPVGFRTVTGRNYAISVPGQWTEATVPPVLEGGPTGLAFDEPGLSPDAPVRLGVVVDVKPRANAYEQSQALQLQKIAAGVTDFRRSEVPWPGAQHAVLLEWSEAPGGSSGASFRTQQLMAQVSPTLIVNVVGVAPSDTFATTQLDKAISTLTLTP